MRKDTETQTQTTNSYTNITLSSAPSKTGCPKCDAKKLPICVCSKSNSEAGENESEKEDFDSTEEAKNSHLMQPANHFPTPAPYFKSAKKPNKEGIILLLSDFQHEFQLKLKADVSLADIKEVLEQFILELAHKNGINVTRNDVSIKELGKNLGI